MGKYIKLLFGLPILISGLTLSSNYANAQQITNSPPRLATNDWVYVYAGKSTTITRTNLYTTDLETTDPLEIVYQIFPGDTNATLSAGGIYVGNRLLKGNETFTQEDINAGKVTWRSAETTNDEGIGIPFRVSDFDGAFAADGIYTVFSLRIKYLNTPPTPIEGHISVPLDSESTGKVTGKNSELYQKLSFSIVQPPSKGKISQLDTNTGSFTFIANKGAIGEDQFKFQVYDGTDFSVVPGIQHIIISNFPPVIPQQFFKVKQYATLNSYVFANNPDQIDQKITFSLIKPPVRGVFQTFDTNSGGFVYQPNSGRMGIDSFVVTASDGILQSTPQTNYITIEGVPTEGLMWVLAKTMPGTNQTAGAIFLVNPDNGDTHKVIEAEFLREMRAMQYDPRRHELYLAGDVKSDTNSVSVLGAINIDSLKVRTISMGDKLAFPIAIDFEPEKTFLLANGPGGLLRIDPDINSVSMVLPPSDAVKSVIGAYLTADRSIIILDAINLFANDGKILRFNPTTSSLTTLISDPRLFDPTDTLVLQNGTMLLLDRSGLYEVKNDFSGLTELVPPTVFKGLAKEVISIDSTNLFLLDMQVGIMKYNLQSSLRTNLVFEIPITPMSMALHHIPKTMSEWRSNYFRPSELADPTLEINKWGDKADPDSDSYPNFVEFALGLNPLQQEKVPFFEYNIRRIGAETVISVTFQRRQALGNIKCEPESTSNLKTWSSSEFQLVQTITIGSALEKVTYQMSLPDGDKNSARYFRLKIGQ